jgi:hypothetical protein
MKNIQLLILLLFSLQPILIADTIPPLPIDALKKIELKHNDTLSKTTLPDSLAVQLYAGNIYRGVIKYRHPTKQHAILYINADLNKNFDFSDYLFINTTVKWGWLSKNFWQDVSLELVRNIRLHADNKQYYENIGIRYNPIWFAGNRNINLDNQIRLTRYYDTMPNIFLLARSDLNIDLPTVLGRFNYRTNFIFQSFNRDVNRIVQYISSVNFSLTDLILITDYLFFKLGIHYNLGKGQLGASIMSGLQFNDMQAFLDIKHNSVHYFYWDTLYTNVLPCFVNRESFIYPICDYDVRLTFLLDNIAFTAGYRKFKSYLTWHETDTWLQAKISDTLFQELTLQISNQYRSLRNVFFLCYPVQQFFLTPNFLIADSLIYSFNRYTLGISFNLASKRTLPAYALFSANLVYQYKFLILSGHIENILDNKYEIIPGRFSQGRKYYLGLAIYM